MRMGCSLAFRRLTWSVASILLLSCLVSAHLDVLDSSVSNYWVDGTCGSDENAGTSEYDSFRSFNPLKSILANSSASSLFIWVSPGSYDIDSLSWPFLCSVSISQCDGNCPNCPSNDSSVQLTFSAEPDEMATPALLQLPLTGTHIALTAPNISLTRLDIVSGQNSWKTNVISFFSANIRFTDVTFSNFILEEQASIFSISKRSDMQFLGCKWQNNRFQGSIAHGVLVRTSSNNQFLRWFGNPQLLGFIMRDCIVSDNVIASTTKFDSGLFFVNSFLRVDLINSSFINTKTPGEFAYGSGLVMAINQTTAKQGEMKVQIKDCVFTRNEGSSKLGYSAQGGALYIYVQLARVETSNCSFTGNIAYSGSAIYFSVFLDPSPENQPPGTIFNSEITVSDSTFEENASHSAVFSAKGAFRVSLLNCRFLRNFYHTEGSSYTTNIYIEADRLLMMGLLVSDAGLAISNSVSLHMIVKAATISNVQFQDIVTVLPLRLISLELIPSFEKDPAFPLFSLDNVVIERVDTGNNFADQQLISVVQATGVGIQPAFALSKISFQNLKLRATAGFGAISLLSVQDLRDVTLDQLNVHNVTFTLQGKSKRDDAQEIFFASRTTPVDSPVIFGNFAQLENLNVKNVKITESNGYIQINGVTGIIHLSDVSIVHIETHVAILVSNFFEAVVTHVLVEDCLGVAMDWSTGSTLLIQNFNAYFCRHSLQDGAGLHVTNVLALSVIQSHFKDISSNTGGAIFAWDIGNLFVEFCSFGSNEAMAGGAIMMQTSQFSMKNNTFVSNQATGGSGGAIFGSAQFFESKGDFFEFNRAAEDGGAIGFLLPLKHTEELLSLVIVLDETQFLANNALRNGGAISVPSRTSISTSPTGLDLRVTLIKVKAQSNEASNKAVVNKRPQPSPLPPYAIPSIMTDGSLGGFWISPYPSMLEVIHSQFTHHSAQHGGVFFFADNLASPRDIGNNQHFQISNSSFANNYAYAGAVIHYTPPKYKRDIFDGNTITHNTATFGGFLLLVNGPTDLFANQNITESQSYRNRFATNIATCGGVLFVANPTNQIETKFVNQAFLGNKAEMGAIAGYSSISSFSQSSSPCAPPNICDYNIATGFGVERATLHSVLLLDIPRGELDWRLRAYSALTTVTGAVYDDYGQLFADGNRYSLSLHLDFPQSSNLALPSSLDVAHANYSSAAPISPNFLPKLSELVDTSFVSNGNAQINFLVLDSSEELLNASLTVLSSYSASAVLELQLGGCPLGTEYVISYGCVPCPLGSFSLTHAVKCLNCPSSPHVSCFNGQPIASRGYWVAIPENRTSFVPVACPYPDRCIGGFNRCSFGRSGFLCSGCGGGRQESWTSSCTFCDRVNWPLVVLAVVALWIGTLVLHFLISRSSGKATILIYFLQTSYFLISNMPLTPFFNALSRQPKPLNSEDAAFAPTSALDHWRFFLCLGPMDIFSRQFLIASVPLIMALQFTTTFLIYHLIRFIISSRKKNNIGQQESTQGNKESEWLGFGSSDEGVVLLSDHNYEQESASEVDEGLETQDDLPIQKIGMEIYHDETEQEDDGNLDEGENAMEAVEESEMIINNGGSESIEAHMDELNGLKPSEHSSEYDAEMRRMGEQTSFFHPYRLIRTLVYLFAQTFSSILGFIMIFTDCRSIQGLPYTPYMAKSPSESCESEKYKRWKLSLIFSVPWLVAVVAFVSYRLFYGRVKGLLSNQDVRFGVLYEMFRSKFFFWKLFELARRLLLAVPFLPNSDAADKGTLYAVIMMFLFAAQVVARPYSQRLENQLASGTLAVLILIALLTTWNPHNNSTLTVAIPGVILAIVVLVVITTLVTLLRTKLVSFKVSKTQTDN